MKTIEILPAKVYKFHCDEDMAEVEDYIWRSWNQYSKLYPENTNAKQGFPYMIMDWTVPEFQEAFPKIYQFMMDSVAEVVKDVQVIYKDFFMSQIWANIHQIPGQDHSSHIHTNSIWSSVFNVNALPPDNVTWFYKPEFYENQMQSMDVKYDGSDPCRVGHRDHHVRAPIEHNPGDMVIFRSNIPHSVDPTDSQRITIASNFWHNEMGYRRFGTYLHTAAQHDNPDFTKGKSGTLSRITKDSQDFNETTQAIVELREIDEQRTSIPKH